jgi:hypothetical protein
MKNKILVITVLLLTFALLSIPVMAAPATKIEGVTAILEAALIPDPASLRMVDHNIVFNEGTSAGTITLNIPGKDPLVGTSSGTWSGRSKWTDFPNPNPEATNVVRGKMVLTFTGGTFEGTTHIKSKGLPPLPPFGIYTEYHMVLQGTGDFEGQTLKLSYAGAPPPVFEGCLIIPK